MSSIQVIDRCASLLDAIGQYEDPVSLKILSADTGLHPSTAFRILGALMEAGFVEKDTAGRYMLGNKLVRLAGKVKRSVDLREQALDVMEALRDAIGETVNLTVREGDEVITGPFRILSRTLKDGEAVTVNNKISSRASLTEGQ